MGPLASVPKAAASQNQDQPRPSDHARNAASAVRVTGKASRPSYRAVIIWRSPDGDMR